MSQFLLTAFIYLAAAVMAVPLAKRLGLGSVLGYLLAGVIIGPHILGLVGGHGSGVANIAEFGVVMMLFIIGLELQPALLWQLRTILLGLGGLQVLLTTVAITLVMLGLGFPWQLGIAVGLCLSLSSTAIVLQSLQEKRLLKTTAGQSIFGVLLFQDIAVIPILAAMPLLALYPPGLTESAAGHASLTGGLPGWAQGLAVLGVVGLIVLAGKYALTPLFRLIAITQLRELFTATALLLIIGVALLMELVGLSPALGAFLAGVVLANSEYRHELEADVEPFKGLLLGLFFITVGAGIDFELLHAKPLIVGALLAALLLIKAGVLFLLSRIFRIQLREGVFFALALAQSGEFGFVLLAFGVQHGVFPTEDASLLVSTIAISMAATPLLFLLFERVISPRLTDRGPAKSRPDDEVPAHDHPVIIAGFGRFGHIVGRLLQANNIASTVLDYDSDQVDVLRKLGLQVYYGDSLRLELLHAAGTARARLFVITIADQTKSLALVDLIQKHFPHLVIMARAVDRSHAYKLLQAGVEHVYRETFGSSLDMGTDALRQLGISEAQAQRQARLFRQYDEEALRELAVLQPDNGAYITRAREHISHLDQILRADLEQIPEIKNLDKPQQPKP
jgi:monovalent cation:H+ antiporter-2, CPA2 family